MANTYKSKDTCSFTIDPQESLDSTNSQENKESNTFLQRYYFTTTEDDKPIKLGDGTYSIVFQVHDYNNQNYAIKLLYKLKEPKDLRKSFEEEMKSAKEIREILRNQQEEGVELHGIINIQGGTSKFHKSEVYKKYEKYFEPLNVSTYGILMPKYSNTLKDILEETKIDTQKSIAGYRLIKKLSFEQRIPQIIPYLRSIAYGIQTLHKAKKCHLDLKPANIFVKHFQGMLGEVVIGDLGFLNYESVKESHLLTISEHLPLGTRHYRSPEQKDYFDISDARITEINEQSIILEINDQKFLDTIIEQGDRIVFSKLPKDDIRKIANLDKQDSLVKITIETKSSLRNKFIENEITQVICYKSPGCRTDLFGLGAIAFDMLTGGQSPERFYDSIRRYDNENEDANLTVKLYEQVASLQSDRPDLSRLFQPFQKSENSTEFAPADIVELILKCIFYKAKSSYFKISGNTPETAIKEVINQLKIIEGKYPNNNPDNLIILGVDAKGTPKSSEASTLEDQLKSIQSISDISLFPARLLVANGYFCQLTELISSMIDNPNNGNNNNSTNEDYNFANLRPTNILIRNNSDENRNQASLKKNSFIYRQKHSYKLDLIKDYVHVKIKNKHNDPFIPDELAYMRRNINLLPNKKSEGKFACNFFFGDQSPFGNQIQCGDWIIGQIDNQDKSEANKLWQIVEIIDDYIVIEFVPISQKTDGRKQVNPVDKVPENTNSTQKANIVAQGSKKSDYKTSTITQDFKKPDIKSNIVAQTSIRQDNDIKYKQCIYYRNLDACQYYFSMMGIYIHQVFFNGLNNVYDQNYQSLRLIKDITYYNNSGINKNVINISDKHSSKKHGDADKLLTEIIDLLVEIYLKLTLYESEESYYGNPKNKNINTLRLKDFIDDKRKVVELIKNFFDTMKQPLPKLASYLNSLEDIQINFDKKAIPQLSEFINVDDYEMQSFDNLIENILINRSHSNNQGLINKLRNIIKH